MAEIKCPHCGKGFSVDDAELAQFTAQIRNDVFEKELAQKLHTETSRVIEKYENESKASIAEAVMETKESAQKRIDDLQVQLQKEKDKVNQLNSKLEASDTKQELAVLQATNSVNTQMAQMKAEYEAENRA